MTIEEKSITSQLQKIAQSHNLQFYAIYNISGGRGWINYKKIEDNDYSIQVSTPDDFTEYAAIRDEICKVFESIGSVLHSEENYGKRAFGFQKELFFMDREKREAAANAEREKALHSSPPIIQTQINGNVDTGGGNLNTGNATTIDNSSKNTASDEKWFQKEIVKMIFSFIGGVGATLVAQWVMRLIGWIKP